MCGGSYVGRGMRHGPWWHRGGREFLGRDVQKMSPGARISVALSVLVPVGLSGVFLVAFVPSLWWIFTTYFWVAFPAFGLLTSGIAALSEGRPVRVSEEERERELLEAIQESGEISAAAAAAENLVEGRRGRLEAQRAGRERPSRGQGQRRRHLLRVVGERAGDRAADRRFDVSTGRVHERAFRDGVFGLGSQARRRRASDDGVVWSIVDRTFSR